MPAAALGAGALAALALEGGALAALAFAGVALAAEAPTAEALVVGFLADCALTVGALGAIALVAPESAASGLALVVPGAFCATRAAPAMFAPAFLPAAAVAGDWSVALGCFDRPAAARFVTPEADWAWAATGLLAAAFAVPAFVPTDLGALPLRGWVVLCSRVLFPSSFSLLFAAWRRPA